MRLRKPPTTIVIGFIKATKMFKEPRITLALPAPKQLWLQVAPFLDGNYLSVALTVSYTHKTILP